MDWDAIFNEINKLEPNDPTRRSYEPVLLHDIWPDPKDYDVRWQPFRNIIEFMLWLGINDPQIGMTRKMLEWIINLLLTLQDHCVISDKIFIPTSATTIPKWNRYFPQPPVC